MSSDHYERGREIHEAILRGWSGPHGFLDDDLPKWYRRALTELSLILKGDEIVFADGAAKAGFTEDPHTAQILVFTKDLLVEVSAERGEQESHTTVVRSRARLTSVAVAADLGALDSHSGAAVWPGRVKVRLEYEDGRTYSLPLSGGPNWQWYDQLVAFLPALYRDLMSAPTN